jgi:hypothetical protein
MTETLSIPQTISKELIANLRFPDDEVLTTPEALQSRRKDLERALALGNLEHSKIKILFEDNEGVKMVETTVWGLTDKRVILKQGVVIPIHRIHVVNT